MKWQVKLLEPIWNLWLAAGMKTVPEDSSISKAHVSQCFGNIPRWASCMSIFRHFFWRHYTLRLCVDMCSLHKWQILQTPGWARVGKRLGLDGTLSECKELVFRISQTPGIPDTTHAFINSSSTTSSWSAGELKAFCEWQGWRDGFHLWFCLWQLHYLIQERARLHLNPPSIKIKALQNPKNLFVWSPHRLFICFMSFVKAVYGPWSGRRGR